VDSDDGLGSDSSPSDGALDETTMAEVIPFKFLRRRSGYRKSKRTSENSPNKKEMLGLSPIAKKRVRKIESTDHGSEVNPITRIHYQNRNFIRSSLGKNESKKESPALTPPSVIMVDASTQTNMVATSQVT
jgi:hypothetical protein